MASVTGAGLRLDELCSLLEALNPELLGPPEIRIADVRQDSRSVRPGDLFAARAGSGHHGIDYLPTAVERGARAVLTDRASAARLSGVPALLVDDVPRALALTAEAVHGFPSRAVKVIAITGTNGKTTTALMTEHVLSALGYRPGRLGTLGFAFGEQRTEGALTTPEADDVSRLIAQVRDRGGDYFVMEASSHALMQHRLDGLTFEVAAFSNLTQDHLDFHPDLAAYGEAKARLFTELGPSLSVINVDDPFGLRLARRVGGSVLSVGRAPGADVRAISLENRGSGISGSVQLRAESVNFTSPYVGDHNADNILLTLGIVLALGLDAPGAAASFADAPQIPGRLERCDRAGDDIVVLVDYAHTPNALERALRASRPLTQGRLLCVFGCGGDRDPNKRAPMGRAVRDAADFGIITNDNPRSEDPERIARAIEGGFEGSQNYELCLDRRAAIRRAIRRARPGDVVLIAGKGHEAYQLIGERRLEFDDREQARAALASRREAT